MASVYPRTVVTTPVWIGSYRIERLLGIARAGDAGHAHQYDSTATLTDRMQAAMDSRALIEQAKGILMAQRRCTADDAFASLATVSQNTNRTVGDVAAALVARVASAATR